MTDKTLEYFRTKARMTKIKPGEGCRECKTCPLNYASIERCCTCQELELLHPEKAIAIVEAWGKAHPAKTCRDYAEEHLPKILPKFALGNLSWCGMFNNADGIDCGNRSCEDCPHWDDPVSDWIDAEKEAAE
jgi:hypothetical protein